MQAEREFDIQQFSFGSRPTDDLYDYWFASEFWPVVYMLDSQAGKTPSAYVGETTDIVSRFNNHIRHPGKQHFTDAYLISSDKFNKSATLDLEANLIKYLSGDGKYQLLNANLGLANHTYYEKEKVYRPIFRSVWDELRKRGIAQHSIEHINNSDLFKYSPYKSLSTDQVKGLKLIMQSLLHEKHRNIVIEGTAGTGKSILAVFLFKLLNTPIADFRFADFGPEEQEVYNLVVQLQVRFPQPKMALVIPMESFRETVKKIFKHVKGLKASMVIGPSELSKKRYDIVVVDEAHRLKQRVGLSQYGSFDQASHRLGFDKHIHTEMDWVLKQSEKAIFFYDEFQSIKPSDIPSDTFDRLKQRPDTRLEYLNSQMRVRGGAKYVSFLTRLLHGELPANEGKITLQDYDFKLFTDLPKLVAHIKKKDRGHRLARMVAGFAWPWLSKNNPDIDDIQIGSHWLKWNSVNVDWINSPNSLNEVGCIHTTQGYDLNYTGVIFGPEIGYDKARSEIIVRKENYHDRNGKVTVKSSDQLKRFILHIYQTLMLRGIHGTYLYVCDADLRDYFARFIPIAGEDDPAAEGKAEVGSDVPLVLFENSVPLYDLSAAAGDFSEQQQVSDGEKEFIRVPEGTRISEDHFACRVVGESMNKVIPNGSVCLFKKYQGGSRNGLIVLAQHTTRQDADFGSQYTVKEYHSAKYQDEEGWHHQAITLNPQSHDPNYQPLRLADDELSSFSVIGIFEQVLTMQ
ncbi:hypothetical protein GCM10007415_25400 [Parapedobacter pyrenivorans]|uniref:GIY-YIG domain-containing protein n=1 Tax=Parapedobacter pyrenivorans TaxID=1305674 RepID=A0A917HUQ9_9SPHI|nr:DNA/RNA helicase domain-containing protein [Parapedobacter pyrenivorans]GGG89988.1 hypothetical protein GCM10007415_25400 [Parapedobacter pyrenivorans]